MALNFKAVTSGSWKPGQSGNPSGRPRDRSLQDLARAHTEDAIKMLVIAMHNPKERVPAAIALLDRGWGKPKQVIEAEGGVTTLNLHLIAAQLVSEQLLQTQQSPPTLNAEPERTEGNLLNAPIPTE